MNNELLRTAQYLTERCGGSTRADLCAAYSTAYYALFETLAKLTADLFVGKYGDDCPRRAWRHIYRSLEHTRIAKKCGEDYMSRFPQSVIDFADFFLYMQYKRQLSDYEYEHSPEVGQVRTDIQRAEVKIDNLIACEENHKRAFCVYILIDKHRHEDKEKKLASIARNMVSSC